WLGLTVREIHPMLQRILVDGLDPIDASGEKWEFGGVLEVPEPRARVNLIEAKDVCGRHIKMCQILLEGEMDRAELVLRNSIEWLEFWSVRGPTPEIREMFANSLKKLMEMRRTGATIEECDG